MKFEEYLSEKIDTNFGKIMGEKISKVFYDDAGLVLITKKRQFDINFFDNLEGGNTIDMKGATIDKVEYKNKDIILTLKKAGKKMVYTITNPQEVLIR